MDQEEKDTRITITVPASLRRRLRQQAAQADRSFSGQIVHCLKVGSGWACEKPEGLPSGA